MHDLQGNGNYLRNTIVSPQDSSYRLLIRLILFNRRKYPDACVVWIDAHADINTTETTESGNSIQILFRAKIS